jgi:acyl-CoA synthetase (AMP-forming)/AMP-acid ligase II
MRTAFGVPVVVRYTSTEASVSTGTDLDDDVEVVANTVGAAAPNVELRLVTDSGALVSPGDVGEVLVRSRAAMRGYWSDPDKTAAVVDADGWVHTGDLGRIDADGNLVMVGRLVEMYIRGGYNVYPAEVERVVGEHPDVQAVAVLGIEDNVLGHIGAAVVVPSGGRRPPSLDDLRAWCRQRLADYKAPDRLLIVDRLPLNTMGKVDKRALAVRWTGASV